MSYNIIFGSNLFAGSSGLITIKGKELFKIEPISYKGSTKPLITVEIRDKEGVLLGKVYRSTSFVHYHQDYEPIIETKEGDVTRLALRKKSDGRLVFDLKFRSPNLLEINGVFHAKGIDYPIIATPKYLDLNTNKFMNSEFYLDGKGIKLEDHFISI